MSYFKSTLGDERDSNSSLDHMLFDQNTTSVKQLKQNLEVFHLV